MHGWHCYIFIRLIRRISYPSFVQPVPGFDQLTKVKRAFGRNQTRLDFTQGRRETTLIGGGGGLFIESPEYAILIKLPEFCWMR